MRWTADQRYYLTADGRAVPKGHPDARSLLIHAGGTLSEADARRYGLLPAPPVPEPAEPAPDAAPAPRPASKAVSAPPHTKASAAPQGVKAAET